MDNKPDGTERQEDAPVNEISYNQPPLYAEGRVLPEKSPHSGHRQRLRERFNAHGLDSFADHNVLELLLFFAKPRVDTNETAHALMEHFGTLSAVFDAPVKELVKIRGVGENAATLIHLIPQLARRYFITRAGDAPIINTPEEAGRYILPMFVGEQDESFYLVALDAKNAVIGSTLLGRGSINNVTVSIRKIVEAALMLSATSVILAHNHTSGIAVPSEEDKSSTVRAAAALGAVGITLMDHLVVANDDFVSMRASDMI